MNKRLYVQTYGCQMNERDSEELLGMLTAQGYDLVEAPEEADVVLLNTCSVREHAEERAYGKMGELSVLKRSKPGMIFGMIGCMAKLHQAKIFKRLPCVDLVAGPAELYDLPYLLAEIQERRQMAGLGREAGNGHGHAGPLVAVGRGIRPLDERPPGDFRRPGVKAFVTVIEGCDKACTYCIVPMTRGQEVSRPAEEIIKEVQALATAGFQEVTLLGQNVNSYGKRFPDGSGYRGPLGRLRLLEERPEALQDFPALLRAIDRGTSVKRLRFTTSHPFDATPRLFEAMRDCRAVCESLHLPVQSGSNRMLRAMRRGYTREAYQEKIETVKRLIPEVSLSTDIIVGFPGETDEDFRQTITLMQLVEYEQVFIFKYSPRPGTEAAAHEDTIPQAVKEARNQALLALQSEISLRRHQRCEGKTLEVLVEGVGKRAGQLFGRTRNNYAVLLEGPAEWIGEMPEVTITHVTAHMLFGTRCHG